jgi:tetratricopeptide (TPR) repeat protein
VFVGRSSALGQLGGALAAGASAVITQAVYGLGGVGKSELALQHAAAHLADYSLIWWITAEDPAQIQAGLAALAARLCREIATAGTTEDAAGWAIGWLQTHRGWLLILDNVNDPTDVELLLGQLTGGHILITTRRDTGWDQITSPIPLDVLAPGPAADLLTTRTGSHDQAGRDAAAAVAAELGYLPLALDQAAAYVRQTRIALTVYLQRLRQQPAAMYAAAGSGQAQRTIARVWDITIEAIRAHDLSAIKLLHIMACYAPDNVPRIMLSTEDGTRKLAVDEALGVLASYSMITLTAETVSMHRLVQAVIRARQPPEDEDATFGGESPLITAVKWLDDAIPADPGANVRGWPLLRALVLQAENIAALFSRGSEPIELGRAQNELAIFLDTQGQYEEALALRESQRTIYETTFGPDHLRTVTALAGLAFAYWRLERYTEALTIEQRALAITEAAVGPEDPVTGTRLSNLGVTYRTMGEPEKALPLQQRALAIAEATFGPDDPVTATRLSNLGVTYIALKQPDKALPLLQRALAIAEAAFGSDHPELAAPLNNLAQSYYLLGQPERALPLLQRALTIIEANLGPDHPYARTTRSNMIDIENASKP